MRMVYTIHYLVVKGVGHTIKLILIANWSVQSTVVISFFFMHKVAKVGRANEAWYKTFELVYSWIQECPEHPNLRGRGGWSKGALASPPGIWKRRRHMRLSYDIPWNVRLRQQRPQ